MGEARVVLAGTPPSWQRHSGKGRGGRNTDQHEAARHALGWAIRAALPPGPPPLLTGGVSLVLDLYYPDRRVRDADRALNMVLDAGKGLLWKDDSWTTFEGGTITVAPRLDPSRPRLELTVRW